VSLAEAGVICHHWGPGLQWSFCECVFVCVFSEVQMEVVSSVLHILSVK